MGVRTIHQMVIKIVYELMNLWTELLKLFDEYILIFGLVDVRLAVTA